MVGHYPIDTYKDAPAEIRDKVCNCGAGKGYTLDLSTKWWICASCRKPSLLSAARICENCDEWFVPENNPNRPASLWLDICYQCLPEQES